MKIPRPKPPETQFKRKRAPPPQATKLLIASLTAGLVFMAVLAIVFVPRALEANAPPSTLLHLYLNDTVAPTRVDVTYALFDLGLAKFNVTLLRGNATVAALPAGLNGTVNGLSFTDANHDGLLDAGDYFTLPSEPQATYHFEVWQGDVGHLVGVLTWTGSIP